MVEYKLRLQGIKPGTSEEEAAKTELHEKGADRLLYICQKHGGLYVKLGQYVASMDHILPKPYTEKLKVLQDRNKPMDFEDVQRAIRNNYGKDVDEVFNEFNPKAIAAASLAQVHEAVAPGGRRVAVKLQYPWLRGQVAGDVRTLGLLARLVGWAYPEYEYSWMLPDFEESIGLELDFAQEGANAARCAAMLAGDPGVHVPRVHWDLTTHQVLVMEFIDGCKANDLTQLKAWGVDPAAVARTTTRAFGDMAFFHGFIQCDPHPGNLMVRPRPPSDTASGRGHRRWWRRWRAAAPEHQLVLLDHGMYRRLDPGFRHAYCRLWKAFVTRDEALGRDALRGLGLDPELYEALCLWFTYRPPGSRARLGARATAAERDALRAKYERGYRARPEEVNKLLEKLPRDIHFISRSNNLIRSVNRDLGGHTRDRLRVFGHCALRGLSLLPPADPSPLPGASSTSQKEEEEAVYWPADLPYHRHSRHCRAAAPPPVLNKDRLQPAASPSFVVGSGGPWGGLMPVPALMEGSAGSDGGAPLLFDPLPYWRRSIVPPLRPRAPVNRLVASELAGPACCYRPAWGLWAGQLGLRARLWAVDQACGAVWWWQGKQSHTDQNLG